ncbi:NACHT domain-containing protein [Roseburia inulinivorans]|jgi:predicted NACHT family NTPase
MDILALGGVKKILGKYADPIINKIAEISKGEWEKFKVDFDLAFIEYINNAYEKYSKIKTILYRTEPKYIYDFFEIPFLQKSHSEEFAVDSVDNILDISNFVIIQGTGGIGKSTLMKHLFINELEKKDLIPIFIELKDINDLEKGYDIYDIVFNKLDSLGGNVGKKYLEYALKSGCFLFLLDGYDEILTAQKDYFFKQLDVFCDKYPQNYYIISSRPYSEFIEFQRFTVLSTNPLSKIQAMDLIGKLEFDKDIKERFINALDENLYERHKSFASNPLLLNIMLLTYDNYAEIPEKLHLFYANAFETLYSKHDATKAGYRRELKSELSYDSFKKIFSYFCFITYAQAKTEFSYDELVAFLKKVSINKLTFNIECYIFDLVNSLCVLYKEGLHYKFAHRSFQEYFTALFLKELPDKLMKKMAIQIIHTDVFRISNDSVFDMLYDMAEDRFEKNILLPILEEIEMDVKGNKYDFYFDRFVDSIKFDKRMERKTKDDKKEIVLWLSRDIDNDIIEFVYKISYYYVDRTMNKEVQSASDKMLKYLIKNQEYKCGTKIVGKNIDKESEIYELLKATWLGQRIMIMSELYEKLNQKIEKNEMDLSNLLNLD